ncbi:MAG: hypothetical protein F6K37_32800 [Moorea sp. SIO4E2]|uniref:hypothetical protein n=1 Tax=Moorena sp. SIO4E2 TaxID=2607826 RepID=UPI0013B82009|nr:hypothetical protein [Moorena sp. SIO4E2]NEQ10528.1 hypothetical protein [Moorena sp. SIO4E2]
MDCREQGTADLGKGKTEEVIQKRDALHQDRESTSKKTVPHSYDKRYIIYYSGFNSNEVDRIFFFFLPYSLLPTPYSLKPNNLYLTQLTTAVL